MEFNIMATNHNMAQIVEAGIQAELDKIKKT